MDPTTDPARTRRAGTSSASAASASARWPWPRCSARAGGRGRPDASPTRWRRAAALPAPRRRASSTCSWPAGRASSSCSTTSRSSHELHGKPIPESFIKGKRFAFMDTLRQGAAEAARHAAQVRPARQGGRVGVRAACRTPRRSSTTSPIVRSVATERLQPRPGEAVHEHRLAAVRPAEHGVVGDLRHRQRVAATCPASSCCSPGRAARAAGAVTGAAASCRRRYQGVPFRSGGEPILNLSSPPGIDRATGSGERIDADPRAEPRRGWTTTGDPEIATRIASYEMAYRMQTSAPELIDLARRDRRRRSSCTAPSRASRRSPTTACWPAGWSSAACGSCSSTTPTGTTTAAPAENLDERPRPRLPRGRPGRARPWSTT